jgi:hypothetical protein
MSTSAETTPAWENEIRTLEARGIAAFLAADTPTLDLLWDDACLVNSPLQQVLDKAKVLGALKSGRIRHTSFTAEIEYLQRHGDTVVVMGRDLVTDAPDDTISRRRFTNIWQSQEGSWRMIARHAHVVSLDASTTASLKS